MKKILGVLLSLTLILAMIPGAGSVAFADDVENYTLTFHVPEGVEVPDPVTVTTGSRVGELPNPAGVDYCFRGWYSNAMPVNYNEAFPDDYFNRKVVRLAPGNSALQDIFQPGGVIYFDVTVYGAEPLYIDVNDNDRYTEYVSDGGRIWGLLHLKATDFYYYGQHEYSFLDINCDAMPTSYKINYFLYLPGGTDTGLVTEDTVCNEDCDLYALVDSHSCNHETGEEATCTTPGYTESAYCTICNTVIREREEIPAKGHNPLIEPARKPTCTSGGYEEFSFCRDCGLQLSDIIEIPPAHSPQVVSGKKATCQETGLTSGSICEFCGEVIQEQEVIPKKAHSYGSWKTVTEPTCTEAGKKIRTCKSCGVEDTAEIEPAHHFSDEYTVDKQPKCLGKGSKSRHCLGCDEKTDITSIPALGHTEKKIVTAATYAKAGKVVTMCTRTNTVLETKVLPKLVPAKTSVKSLTGAKKAMTVKWEKKSKMTGYEIRYSTKSSMASAKKVTVSKASTTSKKISKLKAKKKYYIQIRTYKTENGKKYYSAWSAKKSVKTK